jgi:hypothetical protein
MRTSKKSYISKSTDSQKASISSKKQESNAGNSLRKGFHHGIYKSEKTGKREYYESSYELRRFVVLDADPLIKEWTKEHKIRIKYKLYGRRRTYIPDILVTYMDGRRVLEEVKGYVFRPAEFIKKRAAAKYYCLVKGIEYKTVWKDDLEDT